MHWNVVGPHFIGVHEMIDPQVEAVREMTDEIAERIATLGCSPVGTPGALVAASDLGRLLDRPGRCDRPPRRAGRGLPGAIIAATARPPSDTEDPDPVTNDMLIGHLH